LASRAQRLAKKIAAGAQFIQTQYCFDLPLMTRFMEQVSDMGLDKQAFILVGVGPLASPRAAEWIRTHVPGIHIPDAIIKRLAGADSPKQEGKKICVEILQQLREMRGVAGVHVMAYRQEETVAEIIDASGVIAGREPWNPHRHDVLAMQRAVS
jgi:methylenetetrahydrofolate reductase (NADPH)